jgi:xanthine/uracil permease
VIPGDAAAVNDTGVRYAKWAGDAVAAVALVVFEAVGLLGAGLGTVLFALAGVRVGWVAPVYLGALAVCAGIITAAAWSVRMRITAMVQGLVTGCCLVTLLIGLSTRL